MGAAPVRSALLAHRPRHRPDSPSRDLVPDDAVPPAVVARVARGAGGRPASATLVNNLDVAAEHVLDQVVDRWGHCWITVSDLLESGLSSLNLDLVFGEVQVIQSSDARCEWNLLSNEGAVEVDLAVLTQSQVSGHDPAI